MIVGTAGHIDHGKTSLVRQADRRRHRPPQGGEGARHLHRPRLCLLAAPERRRSSASSTCRATSASCTTCWPAPPASTSCCWWSPPTTASCRRRASIWRSWICSASSAASSRSPSATSSAEDRLAAVTRDIEATLAGTGLAGCRDRPGLGRHRRTGSTRWPPGSTPRWRCTTARPREGRFRLAVDRSFTLPGSAPSSPARCCRASVASTTASWSARRGSRRACARSMRRTSRSSRARRARRCALVLSGAHVSKEAVRRGDVVLDPALHAPTARIDASLRVLASEPRPIGQWFPVQGAPCGRRGAGPHRRAARRRRSARARRSTCSWCSSGRSRLRPATASSCAIPRPAAPSAAAS